MSAADARPRRPRPARHRARRGRAAARARPDLGHGRRALIGWLSTVDHKSIGRRYIVTAFVFFVLGGLLARR